MGVCRRILVLFKADVRVLPPASASALRTLRELSSIRKPLGRLYIAYNVDYSRARNDDGISGKTSTLFLVSSARFAES